MQYSSTIGLIFARKHVQPLTLYYCTSTVYEYCGRSDHVGRSEDLEIDHNFSGNQRHARLLRYPKSTSPHMSDLYRSVTMSPSPTRQDSFHQVPEMVSLNTKAHHDNHWVWESLGRSFSSLPCLGMAHNSVREYGGFSQAKNKVNLRIPMDNSTFRGGVVIH